MGQELIDEAQLAIGTIRFFRVALLVAGILLLAAGCRSQLSSDVNPIQRAPGSSNPTLTARPLTDRKFEVLRNGL